VGYLHEMGVVHRDLKLENVLLDEECRVKLGDLGFVREYEPGRLLETFCGTTVSTYCLSRSRSKKAANMDLLIPGVRVS
jgi:serine/threonine protein kinase